MAASEITVKIKIEVEGLEKALKDLRILKDALTQAGIAARTADYDFNKWLETISTNTQGVARSTV